jgi:hypothetical protein
MKKLLYIFFFINFALNTNAQKQTSDYTSGVKIDFVITNNEKVITNDMIFRPPYSFKKNKVPLFIVNGNEVECISYYNREEIKSINVLQPKEAIAKYKNKGKNGVILVTLKDEVKEPKIEIVTNKIYYKCINENNIVDTSKVFYDKIKGENCKTLDLTDTAKMQTVYINFENKIFVRTLGAGWDMTTVSISGGYFIGSSGKYIVGVKKKGIATIVIGRLQSNGMTKRTVIKLRIVDLPKWE